LLFKLAIVMFIFAQRFPVIEGLVYGCQGHVPDSELIDGV